MGLPVRQRMKLDHIDRTLRGTDPRLAALYAIFGRLTRDEEIPRFEQLRHGVMARLAWLRLVLAAIGRRLHIRIRPRQRIVLFYPLAIALAVGSIVLAVRSGPAKSCIPTRTVAAAKNVARSSLCRSPSYAPPLNYGR
jgi:4-amino-4-deoxy-L-arabinose transferase-like glycosyltransferase